MRSRDLDEEDPDGVDAEGDPVLVLDLSDSSERRGGGAEVAVRLRTTTMTVARGGGRTSCVPSSGTCEGEGALR